MWWILISFVLFISLNSNKLTFFFSFSGKRFYFLSSFYCDSVCFTFHQGCETIYWDVPVKITIEIKTTVHKIFWHFAYVLLKKWSRRTVWTNTNNFPKKLNYWTVKTRLKYVFSAKMVVNISKLVIVKVYVF